MFKQPTDSLLLERHLDALSRGLKCFAKDIFWERLNHYINLFNKLDIDHQKIHSQKIIALIDNAHAHFGVYFDRTNPALKSLIAFDENFSKPFGVRCE